MGLEAIGILGTMALSPLTNLLGLPGQKLLKVAASIAVDPSGCWRWQAGKNPKGYGRIYMAEISRKSQVLAHRLVYMLAAGSVPDGFDLHHRPTCEKSCVNPSHLTLLEHAEHSVISNVGVPKHGTGTNCKRGHEYNDQNTRVTNGKRQCRICQNDLRRAKYGEAHHGRTLLTRCMHGHEFTQENTVIYQQRGKSQRGCKACRMAAVARYQQSKRLTLPLSA